MCLAAFIALIPLIHSAQELGDQLPLTETAVEHVAEKSLSAFEEAFGAFLSIPTEERTFDNTIRAWDRLTGELNQTQSLLNALLQIHPEKAVRDHITQALQKNYKTFLSHLTEHPEIYSAFLAVQKRSPHLTELESNYLNQVLYEGTLMGLQLSEEERTLLAQTRQEISLLQKRFEKNVAEDLPILSVPLEELTGLDRSWIAAREQDAEGNYRLVCDHPTYISVLSKCTCRKTRQAIYELYNNRAYPQNEEVIKELIAKRDTVAHLLGYPSYADYELDSKMAKSVQAVQTFLERIKQNIALKVQKEFDAIVQELPEGIQLNAHGQLERFDEIFARSVYKNNHYAIDPDLIAEYFPLDMTLPKLLKVYEQFFGFSIQEVSHSIPLPDLKAVEIRAPNDALLGVVLLDLFPRPGKTNHTGICFSLIPAFAPSDGPEHPAACLVVGNFTPPTRERPALLTHTEATTLFHEFGHAIHSILGKSAFLSFSGLRVKTDFVEMPSQLLEKWLLDPEILKKVTTHYLTGEALSDSLIDDLLKATRFGRATDTQRACFLSELSLALFVEGKDKNPTEIVERLRAQELPLISHGPNSHFHASWWHVPHYGPNYYSYLWSQVYAYDLFNQMKQGGLLDPQVGAVYIEKILSKGGSKDPADLLRDYLGREPCLEPFLESM